MLMLLSVITWVVSLYSCLLLSVETFDIITKDDIHSIITFFLMILLIVIRLLYSVKQKSGKGEIINALLPFWYFSFLLFRNYLSFGNGSTIGILGYYQKMGILSKFNMSDITAWYGSCICYAIITVSFIFKYIHLLKKYKENINVKTMTVTVLIAGLAITKAVGFAENISGVIYLFVIFIYWFTYYVLLLFMKLHNVTINK